MATLLVVVVVAVVVAVVVVVVAVVFVVFVVVVAGVVVALALVSVTPCPAPSLLPDQAARLAIGAVGPVPGSMGCSALPPAASRLTAALSRTA